MESENGRWTLKSALTAGLRRDQAVEFAKLFALGIIPITGSITVFENCVRGCLLSGGL